MSYIFNILSGKPKYISMDKLKALAKELDIDEAELYKAASDDIPSPDPGQDLRAILKILAEMTSQERTTLLTSLRQKK